MNYVELIKRANNLFEDQSFQNIIIEQNEKLQKTYKPVQKTIDKHMEVNEKIKEYIYQFSPWKTNVSDIYNGSKLIDLLSTFYQFTDKQIQNMKEEVKVEIIDKAVQGMVQTFRMYRNELTIRSAFFQMDYMENRMKYLMENGQEPTSIPEEQYDIFEQLLKELLYKTSLGYLLVIDNNGEVRNRYSMKGPKLLGEMFVSFAKATGNREWNLMEILREHYFKELSSLTDIEKKEFKELPVCPMTYYLKENPKELKDIPSRELSQVLIKKDIWYLLKEESIKLVFINTIAFLELTIKNNKEKETGKSFIMQSKMDEYYTVLIIKAFEEFKIYIENNYK